MIRMILPDYKPMTYGFTIAIAQQFIEQLNKAIEHVQKNPPLIISDIISGKVTATKKSPGSRYLEVGTDGILYDNSYHGDYELNKVFINIFDVERGYLSATRWFDDDEVLMLAHAFEKAANEIKILQSEVDKSGQNTQKLPIELLKTSRIVVTVEDLPNVTESLGIKLSFKYNGRKISDDDIFWLTEDNARELGRLMLDALKNKANYPVHVYKSSQPTKMKIATLPI